MFRDPNRNQRFVYWMKSWVAADIVVRFIGWLLDFGIGLAVIIFLWKACNYARV